MKVALAALLVFAASSIAQVNNPGRFENHRAFPQTPSRSNYIERHAYDVLNYKLFMDWYDALSNQSTSYNGIMEITFLPDLVSPLDSIDIDYGPQFLFVDSAFSNGRRIVVDTSDGDLTVFLGKPYMSGDTGVVTLYYHVNNPGVERYGQQKGFYLYYGGEQLADSYVVPQTVAYTMSEPSDARDWMPCYDDPSDKALCEISIRVPSGFVAASNGTLVSKVNNGDGSTTFNWSEGYPIATYLMCATASRFAIIQREYLKNDGTSIPIQYYVYPEDSATAVSNTECDIDTVVSMIKFYSSIYGEFPFDKYGMTGIEPFYYGGMEHQTITTLRRSYEFSRRVVAHELAHQWWGDMVTLGTWKDIWLNESFATYSEAMELQHLGNSGFQNEMQFYASQYFAEDDTLRYPVYAPPQAELFGLAEYYKGAWVLHMLRNIVGDSTFFAIFRTYRSEYQYGNTVTSDFINIVNQVTHSNMNWFFDEWIYGQGYPVYAYTTRSFGDSLKIYIRQKQSNAPIFKMPVEFAVYAGGQPTVLGFVDSLGYQIATFPFKAAVDSITLDPRGKILEKTVPWSDLPNPSTQTSALYLINYPNPFSSTTQIQYSIGSDTNVDFHIYDMLGREVRTMDEGYQPAGEYSVTLDGRGLASGAYLLRINTDYGGKTLKILVEK